jgi:hypothetical protein
MVIPKGSGGTTAGSPLTGEKLTMIAGDATKRADIDKLFAAAPGDGTIDGVIVALGGKTKDVGATMLSDATKNVLEAMKDKGMKRVSVITSIGAGDSKSQAPFFFKILMATVMSKIFADKNKQEEIVKGTDLDWCIIRPGGLTVDKPTGEINVIEGEAGSISRADVASFCIDSVLVADFPYIRKTPCISSVGGTSWIKDRSDKARMG